MSLSVIFTTLYGTSTRVVLAGIVKQTSANIKSVKVEVFSGVGVSSTVRVYGEDLILKFPTQKFIVFFFATVLLLALTLLNDHILLTVLTTSSKTSSCVLLINDRTLVPSKAGCWLLDGVTNKIVSNPSSILGNFTVAWMYPKYTNASPLAVVNSTSITPNSSIGLIAIFKQSRTKSSLTVLIQLPVSRYV